VAVAAIAGRLRAAGSVFAEDEARLLMAAAATPADLAAMVDRRVAGFPLEHIVGWAEFCGLRIVVGPIATVTSAETPVVLDLCCGAGAVGLAVATALAGAELHAADIDPGATRYARRNLAAIGGHVHEGDLYDPLPADLRGRIDVLVVNAPYVPTGELGLMPAEARLHEPVVALDGGPDGVGIHRRVAAQAPEWLAPGGSLLIETSDRQAPLTIAAMAAAGLSAGVASDDHLDATVAIGRLPETAGRTPG
jgi:release factor glutamine methyltransferase